MHKPANWRRCACQACSEARFLEEYRLLNQSGFHRNSPIRSFTETQTHWPGGSWRRAKFILSRLPLLKKSHGIFLEAWQPVNLKSYFAHLTWTMRSWRSPFELPRNWGDRRFCHWASWKTATQFSAGSQPTGGMSGKTGRWL